MKSDWDDAPAHLKNPKRKSPIGITIVIAIGLIAGILYMADRNGWVDYAKNQIDPPTTTYQPKAAPLSSAPLPADPPTAEDRFWSNVERDRQAKEAETAARQTVFNDSNYRPRTDINTIQPPPQRHAQANVQRNSRNQGGLNGRGNVTLSWEDTRRKYRHTWRGYYRYQDSRIIYDDLCAGSGRYPAGSIEYRACRKVAKAYLRNQCRSQSDQRFRSMYCFAESAFRH